MKEQLEAEIYCEPFPLMVVNNFYNQQELDLIWKELDFYTAPNKLVSAENYGGVVGYTNAKALILDDLYRNYESNEKGVDYRNISNILTVNRKLFECGVLDTFANIHGCVSIANKTNHDITKVRYYHDGEYYDPHTDKSTMFLAFSYFYREPKKFVGGDLEFPKYDFKLPCTNNSMVIFPGWVEHGVRKVKIKDSDYYDGWGRYAITSFFSCRDNKK
jgi:hypothetical protein|tara:strand:- start:947 stop:1597 length:651 start_codon:yes stop_codon:yes gene_type:complete